MRQTLFIFALAGFILGLAKVVASSQILGLLPFLWWGVAGAGLILLCGIYLGVEANAVLTEPEDQDEPRI